MISEHPREAPAFEPTFKPGDDFGRYVVRRFVGCGGMAEVYEAEHWALRKRVALKMLTPAMAKNAVVRRRFVREGERAARIRHPHVVDITDVGEIDQLPYLVMEYLEGETLGELLLREAPLSVEKTTNIILPVLAAAEAGHTRGVIHRDLKPDNIFLHRDGNRTRPKVLDFGVSRRLGENDVRERLTVPNAVLGTPQYMAPEQARGEECDERADQYTLGLVMYEAVTGTLPRDGDTILKLLNAAASGELVPPSERAPGIPTEFEQALMKALAPDPADRFACIGDFARALLPYASQRARDYWALEFAEPSHDSAPSSYDPAALASDPGGRELDHRHDLDATLEERMRESPGITIDAIDELDPDVEEQPTKQVPQVPLVPRPVSDRAVRAVESSSLDGGASSLHQEPKSRLPSIVALAAVAAALAAYGFVRLRAPETPSAARDEGATEVRQVAPSAPPTDVASAAAPAAVALTVTVNPRDARVYLDGALLATGDYEGKLPNDGRHVEIRVEATGFDTQVKSVAADGDIAVSFQLHPSAATPPNAISKPPAPESPPAPAPESGFVRKGTHPTKPLDTNNPYK